MQVVLGSVKCNEIQRKNDKNSKTDDVQGITVLIYLVNNSLLVTAYSFLAQPLSTNGFTPKLWYSHITWSAETSNGCSLFIHAT